MSEPRDDSQPVPREHDDRPTGSVARPGGHDAGAGTPDDPPTAALDPPTLQHAGQTPHDPLAAYALGALDPDEQRMFELHLFICSACRANLAAYERVASLLPYSLPPEEPPVGARDRLLARAQADASEAPTIAVPRLPADERPTVTAEAPTVVAPLQRPDATSTVVEAAPVQTVAPEEPATVQAEPSPPRRGVRIRLASLGWAAALLFVIAAGLFVGAWSVTGPHASPETELLARLPGGRIVRLAGTGVPSASAHLFVLDGGRRAELAVDGLPPLPPGRVYQLWFAEPGQPARSGGSFLVDQRGDAVVPARIPTPFERVQAIAVTLEPYPGSPGPTGVRLLEWTP